MVNKKERKQYATIVIVLVIGALLWLSNNMGAGRAGINESFNSWYGENSVAVLIGGVFLVVIMILWGFHEGKLDRNIRAMHAQSSYQRANAAIQRQQLQTSIAANEYAKRQQEKR